jgi:citrate/tricarballylate utilization protein
MSDYEVLKEAERVLTVCNACRYCEGFCAVFPAMELRRTFSEQDLKYLANLCHNCRGCYYACQYAPPHEFCLNVPKVLSDLRLATYQELSWPPALKRIFKRNGLAVFLIAALGVMAVLLFTLFFRGSEVFFGFHRGAGSFYRMVPYPAMVLTFSAVAFLVLACLWRGAGNLWRETGGVPADLLDFRAHLRAVGQVLRLKYLDGAGHGCNYPDDRFRMVRRNFHHAVFYGFMLCFASTTVAAVYDHLMGSPAPYPFLSWPVVLGTMGGLAIMIGTGGLLYLKSGMDRAPSSPHLWGMDIGFAALLFLTAFTGLLLLFLRSTPFMGTLLAVHLGLVLGLFATMPYGKFIHAPYRYLALVRNAVEQLRAGTADRQ